MSLLLLTLQDASFVSCVVRFLPSHHGFRWKITGYDIFVYAVE